MAFNWFISVIQLQFDLIQTSDVRDPLPTKDTARLHTQQQMTDLRGGRRAMRARDRRGQEGTGAGGGMMVREEEREREGEEGRRAERGGREERDGGKKQRGVQAGLGDQGSPKSAEYRCSERKGK